jgi:two-component system, OmpR family, phosphate regulon response regulator PhoB
MPSSILVIEDEPAISELISVNLQHAGHCPIRAYNAEQAQNLISDVLPDLVLLDWMLPGKSGIAFARDLRNNERTKHIPIIMLTARGDEQDKVLGLEIGADDYVTKPFSVPELMARVRALLRRSSPRLAATLKFGDVEVDFRRHAAVRSGRAIEMTRKEFALLRFLASCEDTVVTRDELLNKVWGFEAYPVTRTVDNHIAGLRAKLEADPARPVYIQTVHGVGYKFVPDRDV